MCLVRVFMVNQEHDSNRFLLPQRGQGEGTVRSRGAFRVQDSDVVTGASP